MPNSRNDAVGPDRGLGRSGLTGSLGDITSKQLRYVFKSVLTQ